MTQNIILKLARIDAKPSTSKRDTLTIARRVLRHVCKAKRAIYDERRAMRRQAGKLRQFLPFTAQAVADLEQLASNHEADCLGAMHRVLLAYGQTIIHDSDGIADALGFDGLCDHLNINPIHREQAKQNGGESLHGLALIARMEDSMTDHGDAWGAGGPLFEACQAAMCEFILTCPDHLLPDPFAPGEMFGPKLPPQLRVV